ncbi:chk-2 [Symbiodinium natans]|uniref:Chk-2 protein n=1 Tax=Symbiodinium natans TaxID=878477 RepID=A0A812J3J7_9DINO|nr:chk-2 [Symbiodinium natans]
MAELMARRLRMLGAFRDDTHTFLVTEFVSDGELFNHVANGRMGADEGVVRGLMWQLLQGTRFLHAHDIGHRDISLENVLISFDRDRHHLRLMDFGQAVRTRSSCGQVYLRYFRPAGKPYYRGPECYVPGDRPQVLVCCPPHAHGLDVVFVDNLNRNGTPNGYRNEVRLPPHATPGQTCLAEFWGYEVPPLDVFALGVCFFILAWRVPPWGRALPLDANFTYIQQHGIPPLLNAWQKRHLSPEAMNLLTEMVSADPRRRPSVQACLESAWLVPLKDDPVQPLQCRRSDACSSSAHDQLVHWCSLLQLSRTVVPAWQLWSGKPHETSTATKKPMSPRELEVPTQPAAAMEPGGRESNRLDYGCIECNIKFSQDASSTVPADDIDMESEMARMNLGASCLEAEVHRAEEDVSSW